MTLRDIERLNCGRSLLYELNINDCRHYVNDIVCETTGAILPLLSALIYECPYFGLQAEVKQG